ncbi:putative RNA-binding protein Luc7-like 2 [Condylostylus longicornis]|uniref:putative RNA-binding protein Luc7-like 2 n=1 Tax=Condylostylus longicornis TaxID=2530218 RepID=UPI00244D9B73|nr:putative RNA-binding protein Luc7-like 2 [Condylostylus longicornis]
MDEIRKQLAELMGSVEAETNISNRKTFTDDQVCKYYLTGLCPHDLFQNTKQYLGECPKIHSTDLREHYLEARKEFNYGFEESTLRHLRLYVDDCDRKISRQTIGGRCDTQDKASESIEASAKREVDELETQIAAKMKEAEELGNGGDVGGSMKVMDEITRLNIKKKQALTYLSETTLPRHASYNPRPAPPPKSFDGIDMQRTSIEEPDRRSRQFHHREFHHHERRLERNHENGRRHYGGSGPRYGEGKPDSMDDP